jgi:hypothetical protein
MKQWKHWALITATVLAFAGILAYQTRGRLLKRQTLEAHSIVLLESSAEIKGIDARTSAKCRIADEIIAGRLSLLQAAAAFRDLDERWPRSPIIWAYYPNAASEDEVHCLNVIGYVGAEAPPDRAAELTDRFHAELDAMLRDGALRLPSPEDAPPSGAG